MNIKETALQLAHRKCTSYDHVPVDMGIRYSFSDAHLIDFAEALVAELAKENKPEEYHCSDFDLAKMLLSDCGCSTINNGNLTSRVADRIAKHRRALEKTAEQIEQETAEAIAKHFEQSGIGGEYLSKAIRSGAWKEYL